MAATQATAAQAVIATYEVAHGLPSSAAAAAARLKLIADVAAQDRDPLCFPLYGGLLTALYTDQVQALIDAALNNQTILGWTIGNATIAVSTAQSTVAVAQKLQDAASSGSNYAPLSPSSDGEFRRPSCLLSLRELVLMMAVVIVTGVSSSSDGAIWNLDCTSNLLSGVYTNADGSVVNPVAFFLDANGGIDVTGNYNGSLASNPTIGGIVSLSFIPTN